MWCNQSNLSISFDLKPHMRWILAITNCMGNSLDGVFAMLHFNKFTYSWNGRKCCGMVWVSCPSVEFYCYLYH